MPKRSRPDDENGHSTPTRADDEARWTRIMNRRRQDLDELDQSKIKTILAKLPRPASSSSMDEADGHSPNEQLEEVLWEHMKIAGDETQPTSQRRRSWGVLTSTFAQLDAELNRTPTHPQSTIATARSVLDRVNLSAQSSTVPAGYHAVATTSQNGVTGAGTNSHLVHPVMMQHNSAIPPNITAGTSSNSTILRSVLSTSGPTHPALLRHSTGTAPVVASSTSTTVHPLFQKSASTATATGPSIVHPALQSSGANVIAAATNSSTSQVTRNENTANRSAPIHPSLLEPPTNGQIGNSNSSATTTSTSHHQVTTVVNTAPVHPALKESSSSAGAAIPSSVPTSVATSTVTVQPSMQRSPSLPGAPTAPEDTLASTTGVVPVHPSMQGNLSSAGQAKPTEVTATSTVPVHPSMQRTSSSPEPAKPTEVVATSTVIVHPSMQRTSSSPGAPGAKSASTTGVVPVHPSIQGNSSSAGSVTPTGGTSTSAVPVHPSMQRTSSSGTTSINLVHPSMQGNSSSAGETKPTFTPMLTRSNSPPVHPSLQSQSSSASTEAQVGPMNTFMTYSSLANNQMHTNLHGHWNSNSHGSAVFARGSAFINENGTQPTNRTGGASATTTTTSRNNGESSSSNGLSPASSSRTTNTPGPQATLATPPKNMTSNQPVNGGESTASTTVVTNGTAPSNPTAVASGAAVDTKAWQNGTIANEASDKFKENKKPTLTKKIQPVAEKLEIDTKKELKLSFPADTGGNGSTGCFFKRPPCSVRFYRYKNVPVQSTATACERLVCNEPYWSLVQPLDLTMTSKVEKVEWSTAKGSDSNVPKTVWSKTLWGSKQAMIDIAGKIKQWGVERNDPENMEYRLILRMLPCKVDEKMKKKRADCHLWPKGTMLVVDGKVQPLVQRKQQSHDNTEWKYMCKHFDLSSVISFPLQNHTIQICCLDPELYYVSLGLCQYRSPEFQVRKLLGMEPECNMKPEKHRLHRLSLKESKQKAKEMMDQQTIIVDDDIGNGNKKESVVGKFVFSLIDPVNKVAMKTPVRGKKCKHWQCFDLETFIRSNVAVTGGRWRCPCCEQFLHYNELQLCALTQAALERYKDQVNPNRGRVEYRDDETYELLPEDRLRYSTNRRQSVASGGGNVSAVQPKQAPGEPKAMPAQQEIEIIEIDSD